MKPIAALVAIGLAMSLTTAARAATDSAPAPSAMPVVAPDFNAGNDRLKETLRGVVAGVDERNDRITLSLPSGASAVLKVHDPLAFNAVRDGDQVEITVENIEGVKTIVGLRWH